VIVFLLSDVSVEVNEIVTNKPPDVRPNYVFFLGQVIDWRRKDRLANLALFMAPALSA